MARKRTKKERKRYFCDEDCNNCQILRGPGFRQLTIILNALYDLYGPEVYKVVQHYCPNMTVCADCRIDDFCHCEGCELLKESQAYVKDWEKEIEKKAEGK